MPVERADLERALQRLGFTSTEGRHRLYTLSIGGRRVADTLVSRGRAYRTLSDQMAAQIAREIHVDRRFLLDLVSGRRSSEDYYTRLREQGLLD